MGVRTVTCSVFDALPKQVHEGIVSVSGNYACTDTTKFTVGDTILLAKIPHGAKYVSFEADHSCGAAAFTMDYGYSKGGAAGGGASLSALAAAGAVSAIIRKTAIGIPAAISVSDNDVERFGILAATVVGLTSTTTSVVVNFTYCYRND